MLLKIFGQFRVFVLGPLPENENVESAKSFIKFLHAFSVIFID